MGNSHWTCDCILGRQIFRSDFSMCKKDVEEYGSQLILRSDIYSEDKKCQS